jgi:pimeloyl-ACP methyl ester carboxylesterase
MFYKYKETEIYYEKYYNEKNDILILPGWGDTRKTFQYIINNTKNHNIYIIDYPNFGKSKPIKKELNIYDYAELIYNFIKDKNINNPIIIAHSFGGRITSILLAKYKLKIKKLILFDVAGIKRKNIKTILKQKIYKLLKKITNILPNKKIIHNKLYKFFASNDYKNLNPIMKKTFQNIINEDLKKYYKEITFDTLIIWGEKDKDTPLKDGILLNKIIKNSALIIYPKAEHYSYLNYPILTNKIINIYIKK